MDIALIIPVFNRANYLSKCLESLKKVIFPANCIIILIDDGSTDAETIKLFADFKILGVPAIKYSQSNQGIKLVLKTACEIALDMGCKTVINLDSDAIVKPNFIEVLLNLQKEFPDCISTGFNCTTKNANGSDRHPILHEYDGYNTKKSVGGINMCFNRALYEKYILPSLNSSGNWDAVCCSNSMKDNHPIVCAVPSVVQHIGFNSSMGHHEQPDVADDFKRLYLPNVTLVGVDSVNAERLHRAADISCRDIQFADVKMFTDLNIRSKEAYSAWVIKELYKHIETDYLLLIQYDGFVLNWEAWQNEWFNYDYVGATWWYKDGMNVGNGGFSLRSKRLMQYVAGMKIDNPHPEDNIICRQYRPQLEKMGIKFAPEEIANRFAIESYNSPDNRYNGQFGFHGTSVDFNGANLGFEPLAKQIHQNPNYSAPQPFLNRHNRFRQ